MKTMSKLALSVVCYHSAIYFDAVEPLTSTMETNSYIASSVISDGWHWGLSSADARGCGHDTGCEHYDVWGSGHDEGNDPWNNPGWDTDPGAGSGGGGGGGSGGNNANDEERNEELNRCLEQAAGWDFNCNSNATINYNIAMDYCDTIEKHATHPEDMDDVYDCISQAYIEEDREKENCKLEFEEDKKYCRLHFG